MNKRLQVIFSDEAWKSIESLTEEVNTGFDSGSINYSDVINEMVLTSKVDAKLLQLKHTDLKRSLKSLANKENIDIDAVIKHLMEIKNKSQKLPFKSVKIPKDEAPHEG